VVVFTTIAHHRDTENTEVAQRKLELGHYQRKWLAATKKKPKR
jgi:hypothetical protein